MKPPPSTSAAPSSGSSRRFNPWPYGIVAAFVVFISGITSLIVAATRGTNELVTRDYYEQELRYQARVDQLSRTQFWSNRITTAYDAAGRRVKVTVPHEHVAAGATGEVRLYRPSAASADQVVALAADREGAQWIEAAGLAAGLWKVHMQWKVGADEFYADRNLVIPGSGSP